MTLLFIVWKCSPSVIVNSNFLNYMSHERVLVTFEKPEENPHYHVVIDTKKTTGAVRNALNRLEPGRKHKLSVEEVRETLADACIYILKEFRVIMNSLLTQDVLDNYIAETARINVEKANKKLTPRQGLLENYVPLVEYGDIDDAVDYYIKVHISDYVMRSYPTRSPFSKKHMTDVAWAIWVRYYLARPEVKNYFLF